VWLHWVTGVPCSGGGSVRERTKSLTYRSAYVQRGRELVKKKGTMRLVGWSNLCLRMGGGDADGLRRGPPRRRGKAYVR